MENFFFLSFFFLGLSTILVNNPIYSILNLILIFFLSCCFSIFLGIEFLSLIILLVYIGAVFILFLFIIMLLNIKVIELNFNPIKYFWFIFFYIIIIYFYFYFWNFIYNNNFKNKNNINFYENYANVFFEYSDVEILSELIFFYNSHLVIFVSLLLFISIVGPVILVYTNKFNLNEKKICKNDFFNNLRNSTLS